MKGITRKDKSRWRDKGAKGSVMEMVFSLLWVGTVTRLRTILVFIRKNRVSKLERI